MPTNLWTQRLGVTWRRTLRFYEHRVEILRGIENLGLLQQFSVEDDRVRMRLGDANHEIVFSATGLAAGVYQPTADMDRITTAIDLIYEVLAPTRIVRPEFVFQWVRPLESDFDVARRAAVSTMFPTAGRNLVDFAFICDGRHEESAVTFRLEAGIAAAAEIPIRLSRYAGQLSSAGPDALGPEPSLWPLDAVPRVSFFCDSVWEPDGGLDESSSALFDVLSRTRVVAEEIVLEIEGQMGVDTYS